MEPTIYDDSVLAQPAQRRRIPGPDARAYTPSQTENTLLSMMNQQGANQLIGFLAQARGDQQNAIGMQNEALRNQQMLQRQSDAERAQIDARRADGSLLAALSNNAPDAVLGSPLLARLIPENVRNATIEGLRAQRDARIAQANRAGTGGGSSGGEGELRLRDINAITGRLQAASTQAGTAAARAYLQELGYSPMEITQFGLSQALPGSRRPLTPEQITERDRRVAAATEAARAAVLQPLPETVRQRFVTQASPTQAAPTPQPAQQPTAPVEGPRAPAQPPAPMTQQRAAAMAAEAGGTLVHNRSTGQYGIRMPDGTVRPIQ